MKKDKGKKGCHTLFFSNMRVFVADAFLGRAAADGG